MELRNQTQSLDLEPKGVKNTTLP